MTELYLGPLDDGPLLHGGRQAGHLQLHRHGQPGDVKRPAGLLGPAYSGE